MAITPATRVSRVLKKGGIMTIFPGSHREGVKVRNVATGTSLPVARRHGSPTVSVRVDFDTEAAAERRVKAVIEVLTAAGYDCRTQPGSHIVYVREPGWQLHLDEVGRLRNAGADDQPAPPARIAAKMRDGLVVVHTEGCPQVGAPSKQYKVTGSTPEEIAAELVGKAFPKGLAPPRPDRLARLVKIHDCSAT